MNLRILFINCFLLISSVIVAQSVNKAKSSLDEGNLLEAKNQIDGALAEKPDHAKTLYYAGKIYGEIAKSKGEVGGVTPLEALKKSAEVYRKVIEENSETSPWKSPAEGERHNLYAHFVNGGASSFNAGKYGEALSAFEKASILKPEDTTAVENAAAAAYNDQDFDKAAHFYEKALEQGNEDESTYITLAVIYGNRLMNINKAVDYAREGIKKHPDSKRLREKLVDLLVSTNQTEEAIKELEGTLENNPNDPQLHFMLGYIMDNTSKDSLAEVHYKKAKDLDPDYYEPQFNLAVMYYNKGVEKVNGLNDLAKENKQEKMKAEKKEVRELFKKAKTLFEQSLEQKPDDVNAQKNLDAINDYLKNYD